MRSLTLLIPLALLIALTGCRPKPEAPVTENATQVSAPPEAQNEPVADANTSAPESASATAGTGGTSGKVKVVAYINVTSGCQASTVKLINSLAIKYAEYVDVEFVDFGDGGAGAQRWADDGLNCMTILFNGSPVCRIPGKGGEPKTVVYSMPEGFSWTFDDMKATFAAMKSGKLEILTEDEARAELQPKEVKLEAKVVSSGGAAEVQLNGTPVFTLKAKAKGKTAIQRAEAAKAAINTWAEGAIHPSQLAIVMQGKEASIQASDQEIICVTAADAKVSGAAGTRELANEWLKAISGAIAGVVHAAEANG